MITERLRQRLAGRALPDAKAGVAVIFAPQPGEEILFIKRVRRAGDPWSGHIAFPGGRREERDASILETVRREVLEELGIDLYAVGDLLGPLEPQAPRNQPSLLVAPIIFQLRRWVDISRSREVEEYFWAALQSLERRVVDLELGGGLRVPRQAYVYRGRVIWGLTARILDGLFKSLG